MHGWRCNACPWRNTCPSCRLPHWDNHGETWLRKEAAHPPLQHHQIASREAKRWWRSLWLKNYTGIHEKRNCFKYYYEVASTFSPTVKIWVPKIWGGLVALRPRLPTGDDNTSISFGILPPSSPPRRDVHLWSRTSPVVHPLTEYQHYWNQSDASQENGRRIELVPARSVNWLGGDN